VHLTEERLVEPDPACLLVAQATSLGQRRVSLIPRDRLARVAAPRLTVVGSINLDLVARAERLPRPGETVTRATFSRIPGGKGANQAVAAARLGAAVTMIGYVADDELAATALSGPEEAGVVLDWF